MTTVWTKRDGALITDDVWDQIGTEVPDKTQLGSLRFLLEAAGESYRAAEAMRAPWAKEAKRWAAVEVSARTLLEALPDDDESHSAVRALLDRASGKASVAKVKADDPLERVLLGKWAKTTDVPRLQLYRAVLAAWVLAGGKVTRTVNSNNEGGACVRFLCLALPALMGNDAPKKATLGKIIRDWQEERKHLLDGETTVVTHLAGKTTITRRLPNGRVPAQRKT
ncbi:hypothetical protein [Ancylobacter polymorphus]|uniref:Uncharacterized protein n=1 Tax=Ancylobacter polymorphus TaxID=223390 RepID=A0ABU0B637_9HYPH|nr:hypothetical protein [Ancylobacter polymorphus]MDQ0301288.1 hypothetical protein [Ancylobacter polymorphus]